MDPIIESTPTSNITTEESEIEPATDEIIATATRVGATTEPVTPSESLVDMTYDNLENSKLESDATSITNEIENSIDNAIAMAEQIVNEKTDDLDIPTFLRNEMKDLDF